MDRIDDSTESGYDGGSQENILQEPHYETIRKPEHCQENAYGVNGNREGKEPEYESMRGVIKDKDDHKKDTKSVPNGCAKFCNGTDTESEHKNTADYDCNKVTIHAIIEATHEQHMPEQQMDRDSIDSGSSEKSESVYPKSDATYNKSETTYVKSEDHYTKEELYAKLEEVYGKVEENNNKQVEAVIKQETMKDMKDEAICKNISESQKSEKENDSCNKTELVQNKLKQEELKADGIKEDKTIVQKLVKVAEAEGTIPKPPTPTPRNSTTLPASGNDQQTFVEEEYSYEPELKISSSKLVLRTRSLLNLDEEKPKVERNLVRPTAIRMKITTGPDGTFVIDGRKANSELNLSDDSNNESTHKRISISGEDLKRRKEEIFKQKPPTSQNDNKYKEEINLNGIKTTKEEAIHNLKKYLKENNIGLKELLTNNNVVIIDTYRDKIATEDLSDYNHKSMRECRITGTTAKGETRESNTLPRANKVHQPVVQRHYFYKLVKSRINLPDEELPDPDKVRSTRQMFQKPKNGAQTGIMLPIAAKMGNPRKEVRPTPEVRLIQGDRSPRGWTDSGSLSSGVSSDMSLLDNMSDKSYTSDEEELPTPPELDQHPVSPEVMNKIRACGTTITYYGGRVISHSHGSANPMTMNIMDEIRQGREGGRGKFRLVKSNSCGSRLELAGTDDQQHYHELSHGRFYEDMYGGRPLSEELRGSLGPVEEEKREETIEEGKQLGVTVKEEVRKREREVKTKTEGQPSWRELIESRKQRRAIEHSRPVCPDMVFEEYQVLET